MQNIPLAHARWIGGHLARLTHLKLHDAFRAADYDEVAKTAYVRALRGRVKQLTQLGPNEVVDAASPVDRERADPN
jgi:hypothetical protein